VRVIGPFETGFIVGAVVGIPAGMMVTLTYQWWLDRRAYRHHFDMDTTIERLRALDRHPTRTLAERNRERFDV
jgi:hypothetical protein